MRSISLLVTAAALAACSYNPPPAPVRSAQASATLAQALAGRVAASPVACLPSYRSGDMVAIDGNTLLFRSGESVWVNRLRGGCARVVGGNYALMTRSIGGFGLCSGDIAQLVDVSTGVTSGSCILGEFTPYVRR